MSKLSELSNYMQTALSDAEDSYQNDLRIYPQAKVMKIGGQSITDRGRKAVFPILEELIENRKKHEIIITSGGGTRARHAYQVAIDLNMPVGVLAEMGGAVTVQNARMLQMLLAKDGGIFLDHLEFEKIPLFLRMGCIPVMPGMPPYSFWEDIPERGSIPIHRTDTGAFFTAEALGCDTVYFIKDEKANAYRITFKGDFDEIKDRLIIQVLCPEETNAEPKDSNQHYYILLKEPLLKM